MTKWSVAGFVIEAYVSSGHDPASVVIRLIGALCFLSPEEARNLAVALNAAADAAECL